METLYKNDSGFMQMTLICYVCHQIIEFMQNRNKNNNEKIQSHKEYKDLCNSYLNLHPRAMLRKKFHKENKRITMAIPKNSQIPKPKYIQQETWISLKQCHDIELLKNKG